MSQYHNGSAVTEGMVPITSQKSRAGRMSVEEIHQHLINLYEERIDLANGLNNVNEGIKKLNEMLTRIEEPE